MEEYKIRTAKNHFGDLSKSNFCTTFLLQHYNCFKDTYGIF